MVPGSRARRWSRTFAAAFLISAAFIAGDVVDALVADSGSKVEKMAGPLLGKLTSSLGDTAGMAAGFGIAGVVFLLVFWIAGFKPKFLFIVPTLALMAAAYGVGAIPMGDEGAGDDQQSVIVDLQRELKKSGKDLKKAVDDAKPAQETIDDRNAKIEELKKQENISGEKVKEFQAQARKAVEEVKNRDSKLVQARSEIQALKEAGSERDALKIRVADQAISIDGLEAKNQKQELAILALKKQVADLRKIIGGSNN